jgi:hypothetical protein
MYIRSLQPKIATSGTVLILLIWHHSVTMSEAGFFLHEVLPSLSDLASATILGQRSL